MTDYRIPGCIVLTIVLCGNLQAGDGLMTEYHQPAVVWDAEALPIGNGFMGGMVFGGVDYERIQFNEDSLWTGNDQERGNYQPFGDILIGLSDGPVLIPQHAPYPRLGFRNDQEYGIDGDLETEWSERFNINGGPVLWEAEYGSPRVVHSYSMTSGSGGKGANMPRSWKLLGSNDGRDWVELDSREGDKIWAAGSEKKTFEFQNAQAFSRYRIEFHSTVKPTAEHIQKKRHPETFSVAELSIGEASQASYSSYRRGLNIEDAMHFVTYESNGTQYNREYFCSYPDKVMVMRLTADKPGRYNGAVMLKDAHGADTEAAENRLHFSGALQDNGLRYEAQLRILNDGGRVTSRDGKLLFEGADSLTIVMTAGTDYVPTLTKNWRGEHPHKKVAQRVDQAVSKGYVKMRADHTRDYRDLFHRVEFVLEDVDKGLATDKRLGAYTQGTPDPSLEALLFQMGRYLLISSSRPGGLAANLQGLWNNRWVPTWGSDYHSNINIQMSYWPAQTANLHELHMQYVDYIRSQIPAYRQRLAEAFARKEKNEKGQPRWNELPRGWTMRTNGNLFGATGFRWCETANAWHMQHFWEQYAFTQDKGYLREVAYPAMKEVCEYWEDRLRQRQDGTLVVPDGWSPEHGPEEDGVTYDQMLVWDLFNNFVEASETLDADPAYCRKIAGMRDRLLAPQVGRWGQLQEWETDQDDPNDTHRHFSHLVGLHPGRQVSFMRTPRLAEAARVTLKAKQKAMSHLKPDFWQLTGWSRAWRMSMWARLYEGDNAHEMLQEVIRYRIYPNMMSTCPPICLDASWGLTAGICEMLLQSHNRIRADEGQGTERLGPYELHILPALPRQWASGHVKGLRARGAFEVGITWERMQVKEVTVKSLAGRACRIRCRTPLRVVSAVRQTQVMRPEEQVIVFPTEAGTTYVLKPSFDKSQGYEEPEQ